ncbi:MAG TPA: hypothetical protein VET88_01410 [Gammaproteobacteria bacterium]|nr:hypothetical protein [Gammaproteobacteria bacterium]
MTDLPSLLEDFEDGQDILVNLKNGDEFLLYDFEMVDESIYGRKDLVMATIRRVIESKFRYRHGTKIELSIHDIVSLKDPVSEISYYTA